jgi:hypothetical protein
MNSLISLATTTLLLIPQHQTMPPGMTHEEHRKQMEQDDALNRRGAEAMGFDQAAAAHHFRLSPNGGSIEVTVKDAADTVTLARIRDHLKMIAGAFARGDFGSPLRTHGEMPPGAAVMRQYAHLISYRYEAIRDGGAVRIRTTSAVVRQAVHDFLRYQIAEHHTGDVAAVTR